MNAVAECLRRTRLRSSFEVEASWRHVSRITLVHAFHPWPERPELSDTGHLPAHSGAVPERVRLLVAG